MTREREGNARPSGRPVAVRLDDVLIARIDRIARAMERTTPGLHVSRGDVVRVLLREAIARRNDSGGG